ncbi:MAG: WD40/YVTN/BNR-like repeat-containing protein, partial [Flavobacteriales bacterium]
MLHTTPSTQRMWRSTAFSLLIAFNLQSALGQAWEYLTPIKTNSEVRGCSFLDEQRGIAAILATRSVFRTMDGGETWESMWTPAVNSNPTDVQWVTENLLFITAGNGDLFRSLDGGNTWSNVNPPTASWLYNVHFINETTGFVTGESGTVLKTIDGGETWTLVPTPATSRLYGVHFTDDTTGVIVGWNGTILRTIDGGDTWSLITTSITASLQDVHFIDANTGFASGGVMAKTADGGLTWNEVYSAANDYFYVMHVDPNGQGYAAGNMGAYIKTSNFGQTWQSQPDLGGGAGDIFCGDHVSSNAAYLMGKINIYKSTDSGSSWTVIKNAIQGGGISAMQFSSDTQGTAVAVPGGGTFYGGIAQTSNGGKTWDIRQTATSGGWYAVDFPTSQVGYVLGTTQLGKTTNGGQTWTFSSSPTLTATCLEFLDAQTGFAGGFG